MNRSNLNIEALPCTHGVKRILSLESKTSPLFPIDTSSSHTVTLFPTDMHFNISERNGDALHGWVIDVEDSITGIAWTQISVITISDSETNYCGTFLGKVKSDRWLLVQDKARFWTEPTVLNVPNTESTKGP